MTHWLDRYTYSANGHIYRLSVQGVKTPHGWRVTQTLMYNMDGTFLGTWMREHMPLRLIRALEGHLKVMEIMGIPADGTDWQDPTVAP